MITFDPLLRTLKSIGMNKRDLQKRTGLRYSNIGMVLKDEPIRADVVDQFCGAMNVPLHHVVEIADEST